MWLWVLAVEGYCGLCWCRYFFARCTWDISCTRQSWSRGRLSFPVCDSCQWVGRSSWLSGRGWSATERILGIRGKDLPCFCVLVYVGACYCVVCKSCLMICTCLPYCLVLDRGMPMRCSVYFLRFYIIRVSHFGWHLFRFNKIRREKCTPMP